MRIHAIQDLLAGIARIHGNIELVTFDPAAQPNGESSQWTPDFLPMITDYTHEDGRKEVIGLLLPNPQNAVMIDANGNRYNPLTQAEVADDVKISLASGTAPSPSSAAR